MDIQLIHALVLTPFEESLLINKTDIAEINEQDFTTHALYCANTDTILFISDNTKIDVETFIKFAQHIIRDIGNSVSLTQRVIITKDPANISASVFH